jgi:hypothetical protein
VLKSQLHCKWQLTFCVLGLTVGLWPCSAQSSSGDSLNPQASAAEQQAPPDVLKERVDDEDGRRFCDPPKQLVPLEAMKMRIEQLEAELKRRTEQEHPAAGLPREKSAVDFDGINLRIVHYCLENDIPCESSVPRDRFNDANGGLDDVKLIKAFNDDKAPLMFKPKAPIPADAVTGSGSGLDPHIRPASAQAQVARIGKARAIQSGQANQLVAQFTEGHDLGLLGQLRVNVLKRNLALDQQVLRK